MYENMYNPIGGHSSAFTPRSAIPPATTIEVRKNGKNEKWLDIIVAGECMRLVQSIPREIE